MATLNLATILRESAATWPDRPAVIVGDVTLSYADLHEKARRLAAALGGIGVRPGEHVALLFPNVASFVIGYFACHYAKCPVVPLNVHLTADEIAAHLTDSDSVALIASPLFSQAAAVAAERSSGCRTLIIARATSGGSALPSGALSLEDLIEKVSPIDELPDTSPEDTAVLLYTSGTTGRPKGAELTHFNLYWNAHYLVKRLLPEGEVITLGVLPLFHSFGQTLVQNATLAAGGTMVLLPRFDPSAAFRAIDQHRVSLFAGVPTMYFGLLHHPKADRYHLSSLRRCISGGAPMPVEVLNEFERRYSVAIYEGYGLSETSPVASHNRPDIPRKPGSIGRPLEGVEFKLLDDQGQVIRTAGEPGEIWIKGPIIMKGYYQRPDATAEAIRDGWFRTGDVAYRDEDGYYFIVDRKKDMIIRGGFKVYPREVEEILYGHPSVAEAAVIGVPDERLGEEVKAVVVLRTGTSASPDELISLCRSKLAGFKCPREVSFTDALPRGPSGKILKRMLRETARTAER